MELSPDKLEKVNSLAKELIKYGIASSEDDAMVQAARLIEQKSSQVQEVPVLDENKIKEIIKSYVDPLLNKLNQKFEKDIEPIKSKINEMISEFNKLEDKFNKISQNPQPSPQSPQPAAHKEPHPRSGNYTADDVQIDKLFYFGGGAKRKI